MIRHAAPRSLRLRCPRRSAPSEQPPLTALLLPHEWSADARGQVSLSTLLVNALVLAGSPPPPPPGLCWKMTRHAAPRSLRLRCPRRSAPSEQPPLTALLLPHEWSADARGQVSLSTLLVNALVLAGFLGFSHLCSS